MSIEEKIAQMSLENNNMEKRKDYLSWDDYFMATAFLAAKRSKDPKCQVGACIVNTDMKIVGIGYNGMPLGCSDDKFPWGKGLDEHNKFLYVCHAELNAIVNKNFADLKGCSIYVSLFPCNECAKLIIQSGLKRVIYASDENAEKMETKASKRMLEAAGVEYCQFKPKQRKIEIDFTTD